MSTVFKYALFCLISILVNILAQDIAHQAYQGLFSLYVSIGFGTLTGLVVKYILDKKYIFSFVMESMRDDGVKFLLYSMMGIGTTMVFWGFELGFEFMFQTKAMRYTGAVLGLTIGYSLKYQLDKRFVFVRPSCS